MKRRKIYYVPGMISLIFLPILCVWYLNEHKNIERSIEVSYVGKYNKKNKSPFNLDTTILSNPSEKRNFKDYYLSGDLKSDSIQIRKFEFSTKQIIETNDTINGIHVIFGDNINYNLYLKTIDFFYKKRKSYNASTLFYNYNTNFLLFENHLWFSNFKFQKTRKLDWKCQIQCVFVDYKPNFKEQLRVWINNQRILLKLWPFYILFTIFSFIAIRYTKNKYINNK